MSEVKSVTVSYGRTVQTAPYETARADASAEVDLAPGDQMDDVIAELHYDLRNLVDVVVDETRARYRPNDVPKVPPRGGE